MNKIVPLGKVALIFLWSCFLFSGAYSQESDTVGQNADQVSNYKEQIKRLVGFFEFSLNTLGDPGTSTKEKDVIINESFLKAFLNDKVQIEDDLDENREMVTHKDVQAYLKDVDFFFQNVKFNFDIQEILPQTNDEGMLYFKVTVNRQLQGLTVEEEMINNTKVRYIEVNLDDDEQVLKIASIYTTKLNEKEELMAWWNKLSSAWKEILGMEYEIVEGITFNEIEFLSDTTLGIVRQIPEINYVDTVLEIGGKMVHIQGSDTLYRAQYDTIPAKGTQAFKILMGIPRMESLDISGNLYIRSLTALEQLTGLKELNVSNTLAEDLFPVRNLTHLEVLNFSGTPVSDLAPLKYNIKIKELYMDGTIVSDLQALDNLTSLETLHFSHTLADSLQAIARLPYLKDLRFENTSVSDLSPLAELTNLEILDISGTAVKTLEPIEFLVTLKVIYLENTAIESLEPLSRLNNLQLIDMDNTPISDLRPLQELESLQKVNCDQSGVEKSTANEFMLSRPGVIVVYESKALTKWWADMAPEWKTVFRKTNELGSPPTVEELTELTLITSIRVSGQIAISNLDPLAKLGNLREIYCNGTTVSSLEPLKGSIDLSYLDCSDTRIRDLSPLKALVHLEELNVSSSFISSLEGLQGASSLEVLNIDNTQVDNLDILLDNKNIKTIYCDNTKVGKRDIDLFIQKNPECLIIHETPILEDWWNKLTPAWQEVFRSNTILDEPPGREQLHSLSRLQKLNVSGYKSINSLEPLNIFYQLEDLDISNTMVSDINPLNTMISLRSLNLSGNPVANLSPISNLSNLTSLDISNTPIDRLDPVTQLEKLEYLNCSGTPIKKLNPVETLFQLRRLEINNTSIKSLKPVESLIALRQLKCFNTAISEKNIEKFKAAFPQVEVVYY